MTTVLLVTGWASPKEIWSPLCSLLQDEYNLIVLTAQEILEGGKAVWSRINEKELICVGWSLGGMLLIEAITNKLITPQGLLLVSSCSKMESLNGLLERSLVRMRKQVEVDPKKTLTEFWQNVGSSDEKLISYGERQKGLSQGLKYLLDTDLSKNLKSINIPTTIISGKLDQIVPFDLSKQLALSIAHAKFVPVDGGWHDLPLSSPEIIAEEIKSLPINQVKLGFAESASTYDLWAEPQRMIGEKLIAENGIYFLRNASVLDIGCGTGFMIGTLRDRFPLTRLTGLDREAGMIAACQERFKKYPLIDFIQSDAEKPLPGGPWDIIVSNSTLQWIGDLRSCFLNWRDALTENGKVVLAILIEGSFVEFEESYREVMGRGSRNVNWKSASECLDALKGTGYKIINSRESDLAFSYRTGLQALSVFKHIGAVRKEKPISVRETRELIRHYENNYPAKFGGVQVTYKSLFVTAGVD